MTRPLMPIDEVIPELKKALQTHGTAVLTAEPGAGKTTRVPLELLYEPWMNGQRIILLEPRRLAARAAAAFMAKQLGESVGETVGYRIRTESRVSAKTRIAVVTEGILTRMLHHDPGLDGIGLLLFDEFHERSLHADLGLALSLQSRELFREDLRIVVMSATLASAPVSALLGDAPVVQSKGRNYPIDTIHVEVPPKEKLARAVARTVQRALAEHEGSLLVFLPGVREIRQAERELAGQLPGHVILTPLYGALSQKDQQLAIDAAPSGARKVVLATSIAESSLTVADVTVVIDSGLRRTALFSPRTGMSRLVTMRAARDSADQRRGRAGRTAPGVCYRLWSEAEDRLLAERTPAEILEADLTPLALELAAWGAAQPEELSWLDLPPKAPYAQAMQLLQQLGALDSAGAINTHGRQMVELGLHPRLAHMLLCARELGLGSAACKIAALLEERDLFKGQAAGSNCDLRSRLALLMNERGNVPGIDQADIERLSKISNQWERVLQQGKDNDAHSIRQPQDKKDWEQNCGILVSFAYPDRIARRRKDGRYVLRSGRGAAFHSQQHLGTSEFLAVAEIDDEGVEGRILLAAPIEEQQLMTYYLKEMVEEKSAVWDDDAGKVRARITLTLGAITLKDQPDPQPAEEMIIQALLNTIAQQGMAVLPWNAKSRQLQARIKFMRSMDHKWPDVSDEVLCDTASEWLAPYMSGFRKRSDFNNLSMYTILENMLGWSLLQELNLEAPTHLPVPSGSKIPIQYEGPQAPFAAVRLQEVFGMMETPRVGYGKALVTLHLLSPASRPVQVTADLNSFWRSTYYDVKKDLKGRYPKHYWPDDPLTAVATRKVRPDAKQT
ncbi:ATP-dependent RNA helicase HrpB [compost metagenome]